MHFPLRHSGLRFFFLTLTTEHRHPILSRLLRNSPRPEETPIGSRVASVWRSLHAADPALTASDRQLRLANDKDVNRYVANAKKHLGKS